MSNNFLHLGLRLSKGRFVWLCHAWWWWIPGQHLIVKGWNWIACQVWGHQDMLWHLFQSGKTPMVRNDAKCLSCCLLLDECYCKNNELR